MTDKLSDALRLMAASEPREAPEAVEEQLLAAFRRRNRWRRAVPWAAGVAAMAAAAAGLAIALIPAVVQAPEARPVPMKPPAMAWSVPVYAAPVARAARPAKRPAPEPEVVEGFIPFPYSGVETMPESGQVIRVRMSRSALVQAGFPVGAGIADGRFDADVLVGNDGAPLAVHFVNSSSVQ